MPKSDDPNASADQKPPHPQSKVQKAIQALLEYRERGAKSLAEEPERVSYGKSSELLRKARSVAKAFGANDLDELTNLCREEATAFGRSHLDRLATIQSKETRMEWSRLAITQKWSRLRLDREIRKAFERDKHLGRRPACPKSDADALAELIRLSRKLVRLGEALGYDPVTGKSPKGANVSLMTLPNAVAKAARDAFRTANRLWKQAESALPISSPDPKSGNEPRSS